MNAAVFLLSCMTPLHRILNIPKCLANSLCRFCQKQEKHMLSLKKFTTWTRSASRTFVRCATILHLLILTFSRHSNLPCSFAIAENSPLQKQSSDSQLHVFRLVQEALANIVKHAHAHDASVVVRATESNGVLIIITDDGCGFDPEHIHEKSEHFGVRGMKERAAALNGTIQFISSAETGTEVRIEFPVEDNI